MKPEHPLQKLIDNQQDEPAEVGKAVNENIWNLYDDSEQDSASSPRTESYVTLRFPSESDIRWPGDVAKMRAALNTLGYDASDADIQAAYELYSEQEWCAGWVGLHDVEGTVRHLVDRGYLKAI